MSSSGRQKILLAQSLNTPDGARAQFNLGFLISIVPEKNDFSAVLSLFHLFLAFEARRSLALGVKNHNFPMKTQENRMKKAKNLNERDRDGAMSCVAQDTWLLWLFYIVLLQSLLNRVCFSEIVHFLCVGPFNDFSFCFRPSSLSPPSAGDANLSRVAQAIIFGLSRELAKQSDNRENKKFRNAILSNEIAGRKDKFEICFSPRHWQTNLSRWFAKPVFSQICS